MTTAKKIGVSSEYLVFPLEDKEYGNINFE